MEPTFSYEAFVFGIIVGMVGLIIIAKLVCLVDKWIHQHIERQMQKEIKEISKRAEFMKRLNIEETIKQLENYANWKD